MQNSEMYFEKIPVAVVKKIARLSQEEEINTGNDWRGIAEQIQEEKDPHKMTELVQQLIEKLDERELRHTLRPPVK
jgi:microsomal dipeptidase-like Zn-dependent dipeptidase